MTRRFFVRSAWLSLAALFLVVTPSMADQLLLVDGEQIDGQWQSATDHSITVLPTGEDQTPREVALLDIDRLDLSNKPVENGKPIAPLIDNDGGHAMTVKPGKIKLRKGLHRIVIPFVQGSSTFGLKLEMSGPDKTFHDVAGCMLYHVPEGGEEPLSPGVDEQGFRLPENPPQTEGQLSYVYLAKSTDQSAYTYNVNQLADMVIQSQGVTDKIDPGPHQQDENFGFVFTGYIKIDQDGEYMFRLSSDDGSQLYFGRTPEFLRTLTGPAADAVWRVDLVGDGHVTGKPVSWDERGLIVQLEPADGQVVLTLPGELITRIGLYQPPGQESDKPYDVVDTSDAPTDQDTIYVTSGSGAVQRVSGVVLGIDGDAVSFRFQDADRKIKLSKVKAIVLAGSDKSAETNGFHQVFTLVGDQRINGRLASFDNGLVTFETTWGQTVRVPVSQVESMETRNGRLVYLSDMTPTGVEQTPYFDRVIPYRNDSAFHNAPIQLIGGEKAYQRAISTHARTVLRYDLGKQYTAFRCIVGLQETLGRLGDVELRVLGNGKPLYERASMKAGDGPAMLDLNVAGVDELTLETDFGEGQDVGDYVIWANARLYRENVNP